MEWENRRKALAEGIALPDDVRESLRGLAEKTGTTADWL
jgi:LDH2 family malate/lactate/ureidoglycolate dehydrogenase